MAEPETNSPDDGPFKEPFEIEVAAPVTDPAPESPSDLATDAEIEIAADRPGAKRGRKPKAAK